MQKCSLSFFFSSSSFFPPYGQRAEPKLQEKVLTEKNQDGKLLEKR